jgi:hypothetical protein
LLYFVSNVYPFAPLRFTCMSPPFCPLFFTSYLLLLYSCLFHVHDWPCTPVFACKSPSLLRLTRRHVFLVSLLLFVPHSFLFLYSDSQTGQYKHPHAVLGTYAISPFDSFIAPCLLPCCVLAFSHSVTLALYIRGVISLVSRPKRVHCY